MIFRIFIVSVSLFFTLTVHSQTSDSKTNEANTGLAWDQCQAELTKNCQSILDQEAAEKSKEIEKTKQPEKKEDGFKDLNNESQGDSKNSTSTNTTTVTTSAESDQKKNYDREKHDCLSKVVITDFSRECLNQFRSHCSKLQKSCGRRKRMKKK